MSAVPAPVAPARKTLPTLTPIPRRRYIDPAFFQLETEHVFKKSWLVIGNESEFPNVGSYVTYDVPWAPVVVIRGKDKRLRAFLNSCTHRGAAVVREEKGEARMMVCKYHAWSFDLQGKLVSVPQRSDFGDLNMEEHALNEIRCEQWGGLVFINFDKKAMPLSEWVAPFGNQYDHIVNAPLKVVNKRSYTIRCNWKIAVEAFVETYHVPVIHKETAAQVIQSHDTWLELYPHGHGLLAPPYRPDVLESSEWKGTALRSTLKPLDGYNFVTHVMTPGLFPNAFISFEAPGYPMVVKWPISVNETRIDLFWYGRDWGDQEMPAEWNDRVAAFHMLMLEDVDNLEPMQKSIEADPERKVPLCGQEQRIWHMNAEIDRCIGQDNIAPELRMKNADLLDPFITA
ncbi:aromatic ring-hydroxylating dioxygenase subunit alpha (plasmid) [Diaphorobacter sp. HDW4B]|uniref:aromatic ring-hydroxylating oxygenase subunit alpha n=1 Tax=Diaphorobacter sp. HDW4B TaxID=2714925 RepID=UPI00140AB64F|nr:aromatic ring-hydroxylating dioxygenase subunit alpha [Diaphorobacter sp. HDW4B]QIL74028.1 aromatic ring-hydroxylating dioxygenase subunit alpha [Diaphorobacter sp. HDW4B]